MDAKKVAAIREAAHDQNVDLFRRIVADVMFQRAVEEARGRMDSKTVVLDIQPRVDNDAVRDLLHQFGLPENFYRALWIFISRGELNTSAVSDRNYSIEYSSPHGVVMQDAYGLPLEGSAANSVSLITYNHVTKREMILAVEELESVQRMVFSVRVLDPLTDRIYKLAAKHMPHEGFKTEYESFYLHTLKTKLDKGEISDDAFESALREHKARGRAGMTRKKRGGYTYADMVEDLKVEGYRVTEGMIKTRLSRVKALGKERANESIVTKKSKNRNGLV